MSTDGADKEQRKGGTLALAPMTFTAFSQIGQIASMRRVHEAFQWLHLHEQQIMRWQVEVVNIPAPPFGEVARATWLVERFTDLALSDVHIDAAGNALATLRGRNSLAGLAPPASLEPPRTPIVLLSAHIDTVFPANTPIEPVLEGSRLAAPGACDNAAGVVGMLAVASAMLRAGIEPDEDILFAGNVGEEGEGNLRGTRHIYADPRWRGRIAAHLVLDGAGHEIAVTAALGSRRFEVSIKGSGGHSWTDAGRPNPIAAMSETIATMNRVPLDEEPDGRSRLTTIDRTKGLNPPRLDLPSLATARSSHNAGGAPTEGPELLMSAQTGTLRQRSSASPASPARSAWNVGAIEGGASVNSIPEHTRARFDLRSTDPEQLVRLEVELHRAIEDAILAINAAAEARAVCGHPLRFTIESIGNRPAGALPEGARMLDLLRAVDRHLNLRTECRTASTDANIPLSLGVEAVSIGAGGDGGGIHTRGEWYDARGRDLGLRRVLLLLLALASPAEQSMAAD